MYNSLTTQRVYSIDAFRGLTILVMIFVNEVAGVSDIPAWMKHMPADADAMTFVDVVFPAFLFIVGMSIPFAINNRLAKGDSFVKLQSHIVFRTIGLLVLGVFMVNAEGGYNEQAMGMSIYLWSLCFYVAVILVWNVYTFENKIFAYILRGIGVAMLLILAFVYRGGEDGMQYLQPQWWGILGLIGWAYFVSCMLYQALKGSITGMAIMIAVCLGYYMVSKIDAVQEAVPWLTAQAGHAAHSAVVLCGIVLSLIFFDEQQRIPVARRFGKAIAFASMLAVAGFFLRPYYAISKIYATPTWCLYSAAICCVLFAILYWLIDLRKVQGWASFFRPAASNPLLTYIIPFIIYALMHYAGISWPAAFYQGIYGILWSLVYAVSIMAFVILLNRGRIRLQL